MACRRWMRKRKVDGDGVEGVHSLALGRSAGGSADMRAMEEEGLTRSARNEDGTFEAMEGWGGGR